MVIFDALTILRLPSILKHAKTGLLTSEQNIFSQGGFRLVMKFPFSENSAYNIFSNVTCVQLSLAVVS